MSKIYLRKIKSNDRKYFSKWWRDGELLKLTSGRLKLISDREIDKYFQNILLSKRDYHFLITVNRRTVGHISLTRRSNNWYETRIIIGERKYWGRGYGSKAIKLFIKKASRLKISKIYLEVRPNNARAIRAYENCGFQKVRIKNYPRNKNLPRILRMELCG